VRNGYVWSVWVRAASSVWGGFYEGVKDFVGKDSVVDIQMDAGCVFNVDVKSILSVQICSFLVVM